MKNKILSGFIILLFILSSCKNRGEFANKSDISLRSEFIQINDFKIIKEMIFKYNFFDKRKNRSGGFSGRFKKQIIKEKAVILDFKTKLMWMCQEQNNDTWTKENIEWFVPHVFKDAETKISNLNKTETGYAGYRDWRMPTIEEAASLLRKQQESNSLYLPKIFSIKNNNDKPLKNTLILYVWTGDYYNLNTLKKKNMVWTVSFAAGGIFRESHTNPHYLRLVRRFN